MGLHPETPGIRTLRLESHGREKRHERLRQVQDQTSAARTVCRILDIGPTVLTEWKSAFSRGGLSFFGLKDYSPARAMCRLRRNLCDKRAPQHRSGPRPCSGAIRLQLLCIGSRQADAPFLALSTRNHRCCRRRHISAMPTTAWSRKLRRQFRLQDTKYDKRDVTFCQRSA